jgi:cell division initiation protein
MTDATDPSAPLTPEAIVDYPLERTMRGYNTKQVDDLLDRLADQIEQLNLELRLADQRAEAAEERVAQVEELESTLRSTLVTAQRTAEQTVRDAQDQAARLVDEAQERADKTIADVEREAQARRTDAEEHVKRLERNSEVRVAAAEERVRRLRELAGELRSSIRGQLDRHRALLDELADVQAERAPEDAGSSEGEPDLFERLLGASDPASED